MTEEPPTEQQHTRARTQLLVGLVPVLVVGVVLLVVLVLRLGTTQEPLARASSTATATVESVAGTAVTVRYPGPDGDQEARLTLRQALDVPTGARLPVQYDPADPGTVYADGDAAHGAVQDVVFGLVVVTAVLLAVALATGRALLTRPRLARRPTSQVTAVHVVVRQGLLVRSWLELGTARGVRWQPVHWAPELDRWRPDAPATVHGDPTRDRRVLPVLAGQQLWPSGRLRSTPPRGVLRQAPVDPAAGDQPLRRQLRADSVVVVGAPLLGLVWAYVDGSGPAGFVVASVLAAAVLFWFPQQLGSTPATAPRED